MSNGHNGPEHDAALARAMENNRRDFDKEFQAETAAQASPKAEQFIREAIERMDAAEQARRDAAPPSLTLGATGDPKKEAGSMKPSVRSVSPIATWLEGWVMSTGEDKYGIYNYAEHSMSASTYYDAIRRHLDQWWTGEDMDADAEVTHLANIRACCGILIEQTANRKLNDDRAKVLNPVGPVFDYIMKLIKKKKQGTSREAAPAYTGVLPPEDNRSPSPIDAAVRNWDAKEGNQR